MPCVVCPKEEKCGVDERRMYICGSCVVILLSMDRVDKCKLILRKFQGDKEVGKFLSHAFLGFIPNEDYINSLENKTFRKTGRL